LVALGQQQLYQESLLHPLPHRPLKIDEKYRQKAELGFVKCNFQNSDKKYSACGVCTKQLFLPSKKKAKMNFTQRNLQNLDKNYLAYGVRTKQLFLLSISQNEFLPKLTSKKYGQLAYFFILSIVFACTVTRFDILYQLLPYFQNF
jgi:hypothetical protein